MLKQGAAALAMLAAAAPASAQDFARHPAHPPPHGAAEQSRSGRAGESAPTVSELVVTARRPEPDTGVHHKRRADQIVDTVTAEEASKLPDASMAEVLQRVAGVTVTRFNGGDPDQAGGVAVRGLTQVSSTLNGRESFSANGGRSLLWEDVTPELMAGVDVYKSFTADQIEGGIGGAINLRTHMPFDFKGAQLSGSLSGSVGDLDGKADPAASVLLSDRWSTPAGRVGLLVDLSRSEVGSRTDSLDVSPYFPTTVDGEPVQLPSGLDWRTSWSDRKRDGVYEALQWAPTDALTLYQIAFHSRYANSSNGFSASAGDGMNVTTAPGAVFGPSGGLERGDLVFTGSNPLPCAAPGPHCGFLTGDTNASYGGSETTDLTVGADWDASDRWRVRTALQTVESSANAGGTDVMVQTAVPSFALDVLGTRPSIAVPGGLADPGRYIWYATMDHLERHEGREIAFNADADYQLSDFGFVRTLKFGLRLADRRELDDASKYNWIALTPTWDYPRVKFLSGAAAGDVALVGFGGFFRGGALIPSPALFASPALVGAGDIRDYHTAYGEPGDTQGPATLTPSDQSRAETRTTSGYLMAVFAADDALGMPMSGNLGLRVVSDVSSSQGYIALPTGDVLFDGREAPMPGGYIANRGGGADTEVLPSLNVEFSPRDDVRLRLAASRTMAEPGFYALSAAGSISVATDSATREINHVGASIGDPALKPELSTNLDMSLEWYLPHDGLVHLAVFHKRIERYLSYGAYSEDVPLMMPGGVRQMFTAAVTNTFNSDSPAEIQGAEIGLVKTLDFLPKPLDGLAVTANYTFIDGSSPGDLAYDMTGAPIDGLPVDQLSRDNYNIVGAYDEGPLSLRIAYTWRSKYLLGPGASGASGSYFSALQDKTVVYNLPVFANAYGQLDFGATYKINSRVALSVEAQNLTAEPMETVMGVGPDQFGRSWSTTDQRIMTALRFNFSS